MPCSHLVDKPAAECSWRGRNMRWCWWTMVFLAIVSITGCDDGDPGTNRAGVGEALPSLKLEPLTGDASSIRLKDLAGRVVLLDFWGTWCPPCQDEFPHIAAIAAKYQDRENFICLPVSCDPSDEDPDHLRDKTLSFLKSYKLDLPTYWDPKESSRMALDSVAEFTGYPTTVVLDRQGIIRGFWIGYSRGDERQIERCVADLLAKPATKGEPKPASKSDTKPEANDAKPPART